MRLVTRQAGARQACQGVGGRVLDKMTGSTKLDGEKSLIWKHPLWCHILHFDRDRRRWIRGPEVLAKGGRKVRRQGGRGS